MQRPFDSFLSLNSGCVSLKINFEWLFDFPKMLNYVKDPSNLSFKKEVGRGRVVL